MHIQVIASRRKRPDLRPQRLHATALAGVDEPRPARAFGAEAVRHGDERREADAARQQHDGPPRCPVENESPLRPAGQEFVADRHTVMQRGRTSARAGGPGGRPGRARA